MQPTAKPPRAFPRPEIRSLDSADECSLDHWLELYRRVHEESAADPGPALPLAS